MISIHVAYGSKSKMMDFPASIGLDRAARLAMLASKGMAEEVGDPWFYGSILSIFEDGKLVTADTAEIEKRARLELGFQKPRLNAA